MTDISSRILGAMNAMGQEGRYRVRKIYLGAKESAEIDALALTNAQGSPVLRAHTVRREFNGAKIYKVDAESHLGVGA